MISPPPWLKDLGDWIKSIGYVNLTVSVVVGYLFGKEVGLLTGIAASFLLVTGVFSYRGARLLSKSIDGTLSDIDGTKILSKLQKDEIRKKLNTVNHGLKFFCVLGIVSVLMLFYTLGWPPLSRYFTKSKPEKIQFADCDYFNPMKQQDWIKQYPFFEGIVSHFNEEARDEGKKIVVFKAESIPFSHPTKKCVLEITLDEGRYDVAGYAFMIIEYKGQKSLKPVQVAYQDNEVMNLHLPESEKGDRLLLIARIALKGTSTAFPENLLKKIKLTVR